MKASGFQKNIGGTAEFTKRIIRDKKGFGQLSSNDTFFYDSWFIGVKTA